MAGRRPLQPGELGSVSITKTKAGRYTGRAMTRDAGGARHYLRATEATAEAVHAALQASAIAYVRSGAGQLNAESPIAAAFVAWLADCEEEVRPQTLRIYRDTVRWLGPMIGAMPLSSFTVGTTKDVLKRVAKERSKGAVGHARTALSGALGVAAEEGAINANPVRSLRRKAKKRPMPKSLNAHQVKVIREAIREREDRVARYTGDSVYLLRWVTDVMLGSGLRISEVLALRHSDIDWDRGAIDVNGTLVDDVDRWHLVRQAELKGRDQARFILLPKFALRALAEARQNAGSIPARQPHKPAIQGQAEGEWVSARNVRRSLRGLRMQEEIVSVLAETGLKPTDLTPHMLRRTAATLVAEATGDINDARTLLGHSKEQTTKDHYAGKAFRVVGSAELLDRLIDDTDDGGDGPSAAVV